MKSYTFKVLLFGLALFGLGTASYHRPGLAERNEQDQVSRDYLSGADRSWK